MAFKFRATAALDLRKKQEDAARLEAAKADAAARAAGQRLNEARARVHDEGEKLSREQQQGMEAWRVQWHRAWIERQRHDAAVRAEELKTRTSEAAVAAQAAREAVKKRRVLERLRDRAWHKYQRVMQEQHVRDMNELATLRFVAQISEEGGHRAD